MAGLTPNSEKQAFLSDPRHPLHSALMGAAMGTAGGGIVAPKGKLLKYMLGGAAGGGAIGGAMGVGQNLGSAAGNAISRGTGMDEKGNAAAATQIAARLAGLGGGAYLGLKVNNRIGEELRHEDEPKKKEKEAMSLYSFGAKIANYVDLHDSPTSDELISRAKDVKNEAERTGRPVVKDYNKKQLPPHEVFQNALRRAEASGESPSPELFSRMQKEHDSAQKKAQSACSPCAMPNGPAKKPYTSASPAVTDASQKSVEIGKPPVAKTEHSAAKAKLPEEGVKSAAGSSKSCSCCCGDTVATCKCGPDCKCRKPGGSCCKPAKEKSAAIGLWDRIRAKKERGGKPASPGDKDYPDAKSWKKVTAIGEKKSGFSAYQYGAITAMQFEQSSQPIRTKQANPLMKMLGQAAAKAKPPVAGAAGAGAGAAAAQAAGKIKITPADLAARASAGPGGFATPGVSVARKAIAANPTVGPNGLPLNLKPAPPSGAAPAVRPATPPPPPPRPSAPAGAAPAPGPAGLNPQQAGQMSQLWQDGTSEFRRKALGLGQSADAPEVMRRFEQLSPAQQQQFYGHYKGGSAMSFGVKVADATDELFQAGRMPPIKSAPNSRYAIENVDVGVPGAAEAYYAQQAAKLPSPNMAPPRKPNMLNYGGPRNAFDSIIEAPGNALTFLNNARLSAGGYLGEKAYDVSTKLPKVDFDSSGPQFAPAAASKPASPKPSIYGEKGTNYADEVAAVKGNVFNSLPQSKTNIGKSTDMLGDAMGFLSKNKYPIGAGVGAAGLAALLYNMNRKPKKKKQDEDDDA